MTEVAVNKYRIDPRYVRRLTPDETGGFVATIHEFPGCVAEGDTADEALRNLEHAAEAWVESAQASGWKISPPVDFEGASGKIALRISRRVHREAAERASLEGVSLNQLVAVAIASYLGQQDGMVKCAEMVRDHLFGSHGYVSFNSDWAATSVRYEPRVDIPSAMKILGPGDKATVRNYG